jgi:hypothetical protein
MDVFIIWLPITCHKWELPFHSIIELFFLIFNLCGSSLCHIAVFFTFLISSPGLLSDSGAFHVFGIGLT